jgi:hypothetical protein
MRTTSLLRQRAAYARSGMHKQNHFFLTVTAATNIPKFDYYQHSQQPMYNGFAVRHFSSDKGDNEKEKEKKSVEIVPKKSSKTDYKKVVLDLFKSGANSTYLFFRHPTEIPAKLTYTWNMIKEEAHHYYVSIHNSYCHIFF